MWLVAMALKIANVFGDCAEVINLVTLLLIYTTMRVFLLWYFLPRTNKYLVQCLQLCIFSHGSNYCQKLHSEVLALHLHAEGAFRRARAPKVLENQ